MPANARWVRVLALLAFACAPLALAAEDDATEEEGYTKRWSVTVMGVGTAIESQEADDSVTGFFDQYEYTPNKGTSFPIELGIRDAAFDLFSANETPRLQLRLESPSSNLGVSGARIDEPFWNQHGRAHGRFDAWAFDLRYDRLRSEELRRFPNSAGGALALADRTAADDRFARERTGFEGEVRLRPQQLAIDSLPRDLLGLELALRGGFESRQGPRQLGSLLPPANDWLQLSSERDHEIAKVGGGLLVSPRRHFTLALDFDHERFRQRADELLQSQLGAPFAASTRSIGFVPDSDRSTGSVQLRVRPIDRLQIEAGAQLSQLSQVDGFTTDQRAAGLDENLVRSYSIRFAADMHLVGRLSANSFFKWDRRENNIQRDTVLFRASGGSQVAPLLRRRDRFRAGAELVYRVDAGNRLALGAALEDVDRRLDFATAGAPRILSENALVGEESRSYTVYGRAQLRPVRGLRGVAELGYREAPKTGYSTELDDSVYGKLRISYLVPMTRTLQLTGFASGATGKNRDFDAVGGAGPNPAGPRLERSLERWDYLVGITANASPWREIGVYASFFLSRDALDHDLALSNAQRSVQDFVPLAFSSPDLVEYRFDQRSFHVGTHVPLGEKSDVDLSYAFTRAYARYMGSQVSTELASIAAVNEVDSDTHGIELQLGRWLQEGLRLELGYRIQMQRDRAVIPVSDNSVVSPFDRSDFRHRVSLAVTLTDAWFAARN